MLLCRSKIGKLKNSFASAGRGKEGGLHPYGSIVRKEGKEEKGFRRDLERQASLQGNK